MNGLKKGFLDRMIYRIRLNNKFRKRLDWKQMVPREETGVVKGVQRRVIVVKSPDPTIFEEAIFIVREDYLRKQKAVAGDALAEAHRVATAYVKEYTQPKLSFFHRFKPTFFAALGAAATGLAWLAARMVGV